MERSSFTIDLGAVRRNAETLKRAAGAAELWAVVKADGYGHGAVDVARAALEGGATALCVATVPEALHVRTALPGCADRRHEPRRRARGPGGARRQARARRRGRTRPRGGSRPPEARHGHGPVGPLGAPGAYAGRRRRHEPPRLRRERPRLQRGTDRALPRGDRRAREVDAPPREQRGDAPLPGGAPRRGALRDRALRDLAVRRRPCGRRPRAGASLGLVPRARQAARARARARATGGGSSPTGRRGSGSSRSATRTGSDAT